jgi:hypothetical protein
LKDVLPCLIHGSYSADFGLVGSILTTGVGLSLAMLDLSQTESSFVETVDLYDLKRRELEASSRHDLALRHPDGSIAFESASNDPFQGHAAS